MDVVHPIIEPFIQSAPILTSKPPLIIDQEISEVLNSKQVSITNVKIPSPKLDNSRLPPIQKQHKPMQQFLVNQCVFTLEGLADTILPRILHLSKSFIPLFNRQLSPDGQLINYVELTILEPLFLEHMKRLYVYFDTSTAINRAESNNSDFIWKDEHFSRDLDLFNSLDHSIPNVISFYKEKYSADRFNSEKVNRLFKDDKDYDILLSIAEGAIIDIDSNFVINPLGDPPRPLQHRMEKTYGFSAVNLWSQHRGLLFRVEDIGKANDLVHKSSAHWFPKPVELNSDNIDLNINGRFLLDLSNAADPDAIPVNGGIAKELAIDRYGKVVLPTAEEMFVAILMYVAMHNLLYSQFYLWKLDVKGAFPRFNFNSDSCLLLGCLVAVGVLFIYTHGMFGWTGCPSVFQVIAMAMMRIIKRTCQGVIRLYVDDYMGFGTLPHCLHDQQLCIETTQDVLGSDAIAGEKTVPPTKSTVLLGWRVVIRDDGIFVSIPPKGINKILFVFFCFDESKGQPWKLWVTLAGVAERYSNGILGMRCHVSSLHKMSAAASLKPNSYISANSAARFDIEMWRSVGFLMWANPDAFSMSMEMFTHRFDITKMVANKSVYTVTDASGWRICVAIYDSNTHALIRWSSYLFPFKLVPELYQNNREYLGVLMSLMIFRLEFPYRTSPSNGSPDIFQFKWKGDNMSALSWVEKEKCNSVWGQTAAMVFTWFQIYSNTYVNEVEHIPGVLMGDIDHNSRDRFAESLLPDLFVSLERIPDFARLIDLLDPSIVRNLSQHHNAFITIHNLLSSILCVINDNNDNNNV